MSTTPPSDPPTAPTDPPTEPLRRRRPAPVAEPRPVAPPPVAPVPVAPAPVVEERVVAPAVDPNVILLRIEDGMEALRAWLVIVGLVAVAALGVALYALLDDDTASGGRSTSGLADDARVEQLDNRVDRLSRQLQDLRTEAGGADTAALANRLDELESTVRSRPAQPATGGTQQAIDELSKRIDDVTGDVEQLKQSQP